MKDSTQLLLLISALVATGLGGAVVSGADAPTGPAASPPPPAPHRTPPPEVMAIYDIDQNGDLDDDERTVLREDIATGKFVPPGAEGMRRGPRGPGGPEGRGRRGLPPELMARYDANDDGELDATERAALRADVAAGKVELPPRAGRLRQPPPEIFAQYDTDRDGNLDATERAALRADIASGKIEPPARPGGRGPGPRRGAGADAPPPVDDETP